MKLTIADQTEEFEARQQGDMLHLTWGDTTTACRIIHQNEGWLVLERPLADGTIQRLSIAAHLNGDERQVWVNGRLFTYQRQRPRSGGSVAAAAGSLAATIPAVVSEVLVGVGDPVNSGDKLILLESMKMVIPIKAPYAGTVTAVACAAGDSVQAGIPLIEVEPQIADDGR
ncbi:MAG: acetyl-CoA carboxylase biotin carboxyl carrier protein subunit [Chloroflexota bacterium]|jgi:biotin carboxyl carrier protein